MILILCYKQSLHPLSTRPHGIWCCIGAGMVANLHISFGVLLCDSLGKDLVGLKMVGKVNAKVWLPGK